jgi:hypothetical protein
VGARTIRTKDPSLRQKREALTLWKIIAAVVFPLLLAFILVAIDMRSDLSELKSSGKADNNGTIPVGWPDLPNARRERVRMIGYMMDGHESSRDGAPVETFILLPEAGQFLHPAHRVPDQMVEVRPRHPVIFRYRDLVWASGTLNRTIGNRGDDKAAYAAYAMIDAEVSPATQRDIGKWFRP